MPVDTKSLMMSLNATKPLSKKSESFQKEAQPKKGLEDREPVLDRAAQLKMCLTRLEDKDLTPLS